VAHKPQQLLELCVGQSPRRRPQRVKTMEQAIELAVQAEARDKLTKIPIQTSQTVGEITNNVKHA
jgi:hypothetical protein